MNMLLDFRASFWNFDVCVVLPIWQQIHGDKKLKCRLLSNHLLRLFTKHNALQLSSHFFLPSQRLLQNIGQFGAKHILRTIIIQYKSVSCCHQRNFFWPIPFLGKSQESGIPARQVDKCSHLFICISFKVSKSVRKQASKQVSKLQYTLYLRMHHKIQSRLPTRSKAKIAKTG